MNAARTCRASPAGLTTRESSGEAARPATLAGICLGCSRINVVGVKPKLIVNLALLGIAENFVGFRKGLKLLLGGLVPGIDVRMVLAGELTKSFLDFVG